MLSKDAAELIETSRQVIRRQNQGRHSLRYLLQHGSHRAIQ